MRVPIDELSSDAHVWIFGISPSLDASQSEHVQRAVESFLENWASHGTPITAAAEVREGSFLVVAADARSEKSGCSIDRMFGTLRRLESELNVQILDANRVFYRDENGVRAIDRTQFRTAATQETPVFDITAEKLGDVREGAWERRAADSWHRHLL
jgi:ribosomal protein S16